MRLEQLKSWSTAALDIHHVASQRLSHGGRVAEAVVESISAFASCAVSICTIVVAVAGANIVAGARVLHLQTELPQIIK